MPTAPLNEDEHVVLFLDLPLANEVRDNLAEAHPGDMKLP